MTPTKASQAPVEFIADPLIGGRLTPRALVAPEGTVSLPFSLELMQKRKRVIICRIAGFGWYFNIGYLDGRLVIQRPGAELKSVARPEFPRCRGCVFVPRLWLGH